LLARLDHHGIVGRTEFGQGLVSNPCE
jgi:hypothetical protein